MDDYAYARREYGVTPEELDRFGRALDRHIEEQRRRGNLIELSPKELRRQIDQAAERKSMFPDERDQQDLCAMDARVPRKRLAHRCAHYSRRSSSGLIHPASLGILGL